MYERGDRIIIPEDDMGIDPQFRGQTGTVVKYLPGYAGAADDEYYEVQFDNVDPPFANKPYGDGNYWKVVGSSMAPTVKIELTPEGIEAFLNA